MNPWTRFKNSYILQADLSVKKKSSRYFESGKRRNPKQTQSHNQGKSQLKCWQRARVVTQW
jgi:hypothetical protein